MTRNPRTRRFQLLSAAAGATLLQAGCFAAIGRELEALLAPGSPDNALFVLDSVLFDLIVPFLF